MEETRFVDIDLAWEMAHTEVPYRELGSLANMYGLIDIENYVMAKARRATKVLEDNNRSQQSREHLEELLKEYPDQIYFLSDFEGNWGSGASRVWHRLRSNSEKFPDSPIEFVQLAENSDEYVLRCDLNAGLEWLRQRKSSSSAQYIFERLIAREKKKPGQSG